MKIKAKLVLTFLLVSLIALVVSNSLLFFNEKKHATYYVLSHLESVASIQRTRIQGLYQQNIERLELVASRTQLRISLDKFNKTSNKKHQQKMNRIIKDAKSSIDDFEAIHIVDTNGNVVASTDINEINQNISNSILFISGTKQSRVDFFKLDDKKNLRVKFSGPLYLKEKLVGVLVIVSSVQTMLSSISDYAGLGMSGETILARRLNKDDALFIMPTRFNKDAALRLQVKSEQKNNPIVHAVNGIESVYEYSIDYRNEVVLSVTRFIEDAKWGLVVKIDKKEAFAYLNKLRSFAIIIILVFTVLIIFVSIIVSRQITRPIIQLTNTAEKIIEGDLTVRANETSRDETGILGKTFNLMTESLLHEQYKLQQNKKELASSEALFRGVLESAVDGVLMLDSEGKITLANKSLADLTGYTINELTNETVEILVPALFNNHNRQRVKYFKNPKNSSMGSGLILDVSKKDGTHFPAEISLTPVETAQGVIVAAIIQDVTERLRVEKEKETLVVSLKAKNAELERFTYTVSHDLKSPLVTISGFIGLLEKDIADSNEKRIKSDFLRISDAANVMKKLLDDLLELSRVGRQTNARVDVSVEKIVNDVIKMLAVTIEETQAKITIEPDLPIIHVDEARFKEVYLNLIENALKYQCEGVSPEITIGVRSDLGNNNETIFFVKDNGLGVDGRYKIKIFELFERLSNDKEGTGVGLAIVKRIIEIHNGRTWVESDGPGKGSIFNFVISQDDSNKH